MAVKAQNLELLGRRIRAARARLGLSQEEVAAPEYTAAYVSHIEHGNRRPSQEALSHIAAKLGMSLEQLVEGRDPDEDLRLEVATQRAIADIHSGNAEAALEVLTKVRDRAIKNRHLRAQESSEAAIGVALFRLGRTAEAVGAFERALELLEDVPPERRTTALAGRARCLLHDGEPRRAVHLLEAHLFDLRKQQSPDPACLVETYAALIPAYFETGMIESAKDAATAGWKLAPRIPDVERRACLYVNRAQLLLTQGEPREALMSLALAADLYRHLDWHAEAAKVALAKSFVLTDQGQLVEAEALVNEILAGPSGAVGVADRIRALTRLAFIRRSKGDAKRGLEFALEAIKLAGKKFKNSAAEARREAGLCAMDLEDVTEAMEYWRAALSGFQAARDHEEVAKTARLIGDHLAKAGDTEGALEAYRQGLGSVEDLR